MLKLAIAGAAGRMGQTLLQAADADPKFAVLSALLRDGHVSLGTPVAGSSSKSVCYSTEIADDVQCLIDFTTPAYTLSLLEYCVASKVPCVIGTTGFEAAQLKEVNNAASEIPVLLAPNTSLGVNLVLSLLRIAATAVGNTADIEVVEAHHRDKLDSPSGTALRIGEVIADALGNSLSDVAVYGREGVSDDVRPQNQIGFSTIRAGDIIGDHSVLFGLDGETIEISHRANSRELFAKGALSAAEWLIGQPSGLYGMNDVLGLEMLGSK
jgi:4-hydroxy-tetrahydrodipicolinate reductase